MLLNQATLLNLAAIFMEAAGPLAAIAPHAEAPSTHRDGRLCIRPRLHGLFIIAPVSPLFQKLKKKNEKGAVHAKALPFYLGATQSKPRGRRDEGRLTQDPTRRTNHQRKLTGCWATIRGFCCSSAGAISMGAVFWGGSTVGISMRDSVRFWFKEGGCV
ncbi:hypothetical protein EDB81DRAFT_794791 [Dactylonectria macrodidyma]|uniref:Secreted protein n=1 Tax=Dactylonectria macrodidyma TaxID=307937 RepID=A0A9P9EXD4_9HYPO|nr:hypothetical protein EDB81DRAFT_794791 [Dactylonectria macrodidyma]